MAYKTSIEVAIKGAKDLSIFRDQLKDTNKLIEVSNRLLKKRAEVNSVDLLPSIKNLNKSLSESVDQFNKSVLGTKAATDAAKNLVVAERAVNKELQERSKLLNSIRGVNPSQYGQPAGPKLLAGQTSSIAEDGTGTLKGQRVNIQKRLEESVELQNKLALMERGGLELQAEKNKLVNAELDARAELVQKVIEKNIEERAAVQKSLAPTATGTRVQQEQNKLVNQQLNAKAEIAQKNIEEFKAVQRALAPKREGNRLQQEENRLINQALELRAQDFEAARQERVKQSVHDKKLRMDNKLGMGREGRFGLNRVGRNLRGRGKQAQQARGNAASNAMIGGAFPLLFGQGAGAAAGGALGGALGGLMGGQFGFALSLVGTNLGSLVDRLVQGAAELGKAMGPFAQDTKAVTEAMGMQGSVQEARLNLIEETKGKTAAFNAAMKIMALEVGDRGVQALQQFGESARLMGGAFALLGTRLQALAAGFGNFILQITGVKNALEKGEARQIVSFAASQGNKEAQGLVQRRDSLGKVKGSRKRFLTDKTAELTLDEKVFAVREKISTQIDLLTTTQDSLLEDKRKEVELNDKIKEIMKEGINKELAKEIAGIEQKWEKGQEILDAQREQAGFALFNAAKEGESAEKIKLKEEAYREIVNKINQYKEGLAEAIGLTKSLNDETGKTEVTWEQIKSTVATGLTDAVMGLIDGTKSLGESLASIAKSIGRMFLNAAFQNMMPASLTGAVTAAEGGYWTNGIKPFASGGLVTRPTIGLVGEAGEDEYIIPASKMSGAMDRYSAGARGQAVIPGGGTVASGSGVSSAPTTVNYTGPVLSFNSEAYVPKSAIPEIINSAARRGAQEGQSKVFSQLKNSRSQRSRVGL